MSFVQALATQHLTPKQGCPASKDIWLRECSAYDMLGAWEPVIINGKERRIDSMHVKPDAMNSILCLTLSANDEVAQTLWIELDKLREEVNQYGSQVSFKLRYGSGALAIKHLRDACEEQGVTLGERTAYALVNGLAETACTDRTAMAARA